MAGPPRQILRNMCVILTTEKGISGEPVPAENPIFADTMALLPFAVTRAQSKIWFSENKTGQATGNPFFDNSTPILVVRELFPHPDDTPEAPSATASNLTLSCPPAS